MKNKRSSFFGRLTITIFSLITLLGVLFIATTYLSVTYYHEINTQLLNKDMAGHIAKFSSPFEGNGINKKKADSVFYNAMVLSPTAEVYFLDTAGTVIAFHASEKDILNWTIPLVPIKKYISTHGEKYIRNTDPKDPSHNKIFSAAEVKRNERSLGYIYVILASKKSESILHMIFGEHVFNLATKVLAGIILISLLLSFLYLRRVRKNYDHIVSVLNRFENGDYKARFNKNQRNELQPVTQAFNKMADLLSATIHQLKTSEQERKNFIAIISHDLRTPLAIARGYMETLLLKKEKGQLASQEDEQYSQLIHNKILQIETMVRQLFDLSKMEAVEFTVKNEPFILSEIVQEVINNFQMIAEAKQIELKCRECIDHIWIRADIGMIERVIQNLLENAVNNTKAGNSIDVYLNVINNRLEFNIENDGSALPEDLITWVNDVNKESKVPASRPKKIGLGLLIVKKILQLHSTSLHASSNNGKNTFNFSLPVHDLKE